MWSRYHARLMGVGIRVQLCPVGQCLLQTVCCWGEWEGHGELAQVPPAQRSCHVLSNPLVSFPKKHFLLLWSHIKACLGKAGAHSSHVVQQQWGVGEPYTEPPQHQEPHALLCPPLPHGMTQLCRLQG